MNNIDFKVIIPKRNLEKIIANKNNKINKNNDSLNLEIGIHSKNKCKNTKNKSYFSSKDLMKLIDSKQYVIYESSDIFADVLSEGKKLFEQTIKIEDRNDYSPTCLDHFDKVIKLYRDDIFSTRIDKAFLNLCIKYNYEPPKLYDNVDENYFYFYNFIYDTYELFLLVGQLNTYQDNYDNMKLLNRYYHNMDIIEVANKKFYNYLEKYKTYDTLRFNILDMEHLYNDIINSEDNIQVNFSEERYQMVVTTEELIVPIVHEIKNLFCNLTKELEYKICKECNNLYKARAGQFMCTRKECLKKRDRERKRKNSKTVQQ